MIHGVDVSNNNGAFAWTSEAFGFAKATEGTFFKDPLFLTNWLQMSAKGILRGAYHFGHPGTSAADQAAFFVAYVKAHTLEVNDVVALDLEVTDGLTPAEVAAWAVTFCEAVEKATGKNTWIYTTHSFIDEGCCEGLFTRPLWIADPSAPEGQPASVHPWPVWAAHQYGSSRGVDQDVLNGDGEVWRKLANLVHVTKTVTSSWLCQGQLSLTELCAGKFGGTSVEGLGASTVLRMTLEHSPDHVFADALAAYISRGDLAGSAVPRGTTLFYPKRVQV
jgi:GH25 family lysozyme M1 (1,4-beta-N-acetylmuramidase)